jgi:hypothetical protein
MRRHSYGTLPACKSLGPWFPICPKPPPSSEVAVRTLAKLKRYLSRWYKLFWPKPDLEHGFGELRFEQSEDNDFTIILDVTKRSSSCLTIHLLERLRSFLEIDAPEWRIIVPTFEAAAAIAIYPNAVLLNPNQELPMDQFLQSVVARRQEDCTLVEISVFRCPDFD